MKIVIATDSFKGSLSTTRGGEAVATGIKRVFPHAQTIIRPIADGGEGTVDSMSELEGSVLHSIMVCGPLGKKVLASYVICNNTAVIEMSAAAGITLVDKADLNPLETTTYGVGEIIRDAIEKGCRSFIIGIGGSATNDGGTGMLSALGFEFKDADENPIPPGAKGLKMLCSVSRENALPQLDECTFNIACDVTNPLCGEKGCSAVYGPQKGATPEMIKDMDEWLMHYARLTPHINPDTPGAGAAGGMGYGFLAYLNGRLESGIKLIIRETRLEDYIKDADIVVTGEGRLDGQSAMGKAPVGVSQLAKKYNKPVIAFSGCVTDDAKILNQCGIDAFFPILKGICTLDEALDEKNAFNNLADTAEQAFRLVNTFDKLSKSVKDVDK